MARATFLSFSPPFLGEAEMNEVLDSLRSGWITTGPKVRTFEEAFARYVGAPSAVGVSSGTAAMQVSLAAMGVGEGDIVVTSPMTFCSTVHVIEQLGATPLLVDIDPVSMNIDPDKTEAALSRGDQVTALLPVHMAGRACDLDTLYGLARERDCLVVEDAAHALPTTFSGGLVGRIREDLSGHAVCFSFYATKNVTTGEGGMITASEDFAQELRIWSLHGMSRDAYGRYEQGGAWYYEVVRPGFKANLTDVQAAIGIHQLRRLEETHARRAGIAAQYTEAFAVVEELETPTTPEVGSHAWHLYVLRLSLDSLSIDRAEFIEQLTKRNIGSSVHFIPVHLHPYYRNRYGFRPEDFPVALREYMRCVSLPLHPGLSDDDVNDVIEAVVEIVDQHRV